MNHDGISEVSSTLPCHFGQPSNSAEQAVSLALRHALRGNYTLFDNIILPTSRHEIPTTQIDHILVSNYGIFCLETKGNKGSVYGWSKKPRAWTNYQYGRKYRIEQNPLHQNYGHVKALEYTLGDLCKSKPIVSLIVFPYINRATVDHQEWDLSIPGTLERIAQRNTKIYTDAEVEEICRRLNVATPYQTGLQYAHVRHVQRFARAS